MTIEIKGTTYQLLHEKAMYKPDEALLIIADVHLGKASHFRKEGIAIPAHAQMADYQRLEALFLKTQPRKVYFLGDLFHSTFNRDWHHFCDLVAAFPGIAFTLIRGNHDLINSKLFRDICIHVTDTIEDGGIIYSHAPLTSMPGGKLNITGHIHPGIVLSGAGRQSIKLPCFYKKDELLVLPAFGILTGLYSIDTADADIYAVLSDSVLKI